MSALEIELDVSAYQDKETLSFEPEVVYSWPRGSARINRSLRHPILVSLAQGYSQAQIRNSINQESTDLLGENVVPNIVNAAHAEFGTVNTEQLVLKALGQRELTFPEVVVPFDWPSRERLTAREAQIIYFKVLNPSFTRPEISESLGFSSAVLMRDTASMVHKLQARSPVQAAVISLAAKIARVDLVQDEPRSGDSERILDRLHEFERTRASRAITWESYRVSLFPSSEADKEKTREIYDRKDQESSTLTLYQCDILALLAQGYNSPDVSKLLVNHPSSQTIKNICREIYQRSGAKNARDAVFIALKKGDLSLSSILAKYDWNQRQPLTPREIQLIDYIVNHPDWVTDKPSSDPEITPRTYKNHITKILTKLRARDTTHAAIIGQAAKKAGIDLSRVIRYDLTLIQRILEGKDNDLKSPDEPKTATLQPKDQQGILSSLEFMLNRGTGIFLINSSQQVCFLAAAQTEGQLFDVLKTDKGHRFDSLAAQIEDFHPSKPFPWRSNWTVVMLDSTTLEKQTATLHPPTKHVIETLLHFVQKAEGDHLQLADRLRARLLS